jgi:thiosulfate reductase cytochrome b subunit
MQVNDIDAPKTARERRERLILWGAMIGGVFAAGVAFIYKVAEFIFTLNSNEVKGFADVPVTVYFVVAAGWLCLLVWCFVTGKFTDVESTKYEMLEMEAEYERRGE